MVHPWSTTRKRPEPPVTPDTKTPRTVGVSPSAPGGTRTHDPRLRRERGETSTAPNGSQAVVSPLGRAGPRVQPSHSVSTLHKPFGPPVVHGTPGPRAPLRALEGGAGRLLTVREAAERLAVST